MCADSNYRLCFPRFGVALWLILLAPVSVAERNYFRTFGERQGLMNPLIRQISQDTAGYLWVTTAHGLYRFDGEDFEYMAHQGLTANDIAWTHGATDGSIWVVDSKGIGRYKDKHYKKIFKFEGQREFEKFPQRITSDKEGYLWFIRGANQLERTPLKGEGGAQMVAKEPAGLWSLLALSDGSILAGCGETLCTFNNGSWSRVTTPLGRYAMLHQAKDGSVYARSSFRILRRARGEAEFMDITAGLAPLSADQPVPALTTDFNRHLITNTAKGIARRNGERWEVISEGDGLNNEVITAAFTDKDGGIWIGTSNGLRRWLGDGAWRVIGAEEGLPRRGVESVVEGRGQVWVGAGVAGVYRGTQRNNSWRFEELEGSLAANAVLPVRGSLWIGLLAGGIVSYGPDARITSVKGVDASARVYDFSMDNEGRVLAATTKGFYREDSPGVMTALLSGQEVYTISYSSNGDFWLGLEAGTARLRNGKLETFKTDDGPEKRGVRAIHGAADGTVWMGAWRQDGLRAYRLENGVLRAQNYETPSGAKLSTFFIRSDHNNRMWAGSVRGLNALEEGQWRSYGTGQGLGGDQCTAACFLRNGSIWFATSGGIALFEPPKEKPSYDPPAVVIKNATARFGKEIPLTGAEIPANESDVSVGYAVLSTALDAPPEVRFRLGPNEAWRWAKNRRLEFLNLAPGMYQLEMQAHGRNGKWSGQPASLSFRILPPWWRTLWFRLFIGLLGVAGFALAMRLKARQAERQNLERLKELFDQFPGFCFIVDPAGRFLMANKAFLTWAKLREEELIGHTSQQVLKPTIADHFQKHLDLARKGQEPMEYLDEYHFKTGLIVLDVTLFPLRSKGARIEAFCLLAIDITARRKLELERENILKELSAADQRYQLFVKNSTEQIWRVELEPPISMHMSMQECIDAVYERGIVREVNESAAKRYGLTPEELVGRPMNQVRDKNNPENAESDRQWYRSGFNMKDHVAVNKDPSGRRMVLLTNTIGIVEDGLLVRIWGISRDITQSRRLSEMIAITAGGVAGEIEGRLLDLLVGRLATVLEAQCSFVAKLNQTNERLEIISVWGGVQPQRLGQPLTGEPSDRLLNLKKGEMFTGEAARAFDFAETLLGCPPNACWVEPLVTASGELAGVLALLYETMPTVDTESMEVLRIFATRAATELERLKAAAEVLRYQEQLRALTSRNHQLVEKERGRLAREIHDELGQHLTAIKIGLSSLGGKIKKGEATSALPLVDELKGLIDETVTSIRRIATELRPPVLDNLGLGAAVQWQAKETEKRLGIPVDCQITRVDVAGIIATTAFRILQESLTNVSRHADAALIEVGLTQSDGILRLTVRDDGKGFDPLIWRHSLGLLGMKERAAAVGGSVRITSRFGEGSIVVAELPCQPPRDNEDEW